MQRYTINDNHIGLVVSEILWYTDRQTDNLLLFMKGLCPLVMFINKLFPFSMEILLKKNAQMFSITKLIGTDKFLLPLVFKEKN